MKRSLGALGLFLSATFASGCPVYSNNVIPAECIYATDCPFGYRCSGGFCIESPPHIGPVSDGGGRDAVTDGGEAGHDAASDGTGDVGLGDASSDGSTSSDAGPVVFCGNPNDCTAGEICSADGVCRRGTCLTTPCINQYQCATSSSGATCVRADAKGCSADRHCLGNERCIDGTCTGVTELCTDRTQCGAGKACADGRCVATCTTDGQCAPGFLCRTALGICGAKAKTCVQTNDCGGQGQVCVDGACVPRCNAAGVCGEGAGAGVCIDNGCVPSAKLTAECERQGTTAGCVSGGICLHRHCYAQCAADAGSGACTQSSAPVCKVVIAGGTSYGVCGTAETLGPDCDLTAGRACTDGKTCIDGYCR
jgi:hypothetical protein